MNPIPVPPSTLVTLWQRPALLVAGVVMLACVHALGIVLAPPLTSTTAADPDFWLRLSIIDELYHHGGWHDHFLSRSNAPYGVSHHWSRAWDILLLAPSALMAYFMPFREAMLVVAPWLNWLALMLTLAAMLLLARQFHPSNGTLWLILLAGWIYLPFTASYTAIDSDQHPWFAACLMWQLALAVRLTQYPTSRGAAILGIVGGLGVWLSVEYMLCAALILSWLALCWVRSALIPSATPVSRYSHAQWLPQHHELFWQVASATALTLALALAIEQPPHMWLTVQHDTLSVVQLGLFTMAAMAEQRRADIHPPTLNWHRH